jgi:hypothetical protein
MVHKITELVDENTYVRVTQYMVASVFFSSISWPDHAQR